MTEQVRLNVVDNGEEVEMEFDSLSELSDLLRRAGVCRDQPKEIDADDNGTFDVEVGDDGTLMIADENAEFDYGENPTSRKGFTYDVDPYKYQGDAHLRTRYVPARSADNPLSLMRTSRKFGSYLDEVEKAQTKTLRPSR